MTSGPGAVTDDEVRRVILEHLDRLSEHVAAASAAQDDDRSRATLAGIQSRLRQHRKAFGEA